MKAMKVNLKRPASPRPAKAATCSTRKGARSRDGNVGTPSHIVGLGSSAGGLEACEEFFRHLSPDSGMGFVLVAHLDPTHKALLPELLRRSTTMKVQQAEEGMKVRPNCVFVIPPNADLSIKRGRLHLLEPGSPRGSRMPIDFFFQQLAKDQRGRAIAIILSGMGMDGSLGLRAIKDNLGLVLVQDARTARFEGMPRSAIETGLADFVAPASALPAKLMKYARHAASGTRQPLSATDKATGILHKVFVQLRAQTGHDFSFYKKNTVYRRLERRMAVHNHHHLAQYLRYLQEHPEETKLLFRELLIGVTNFFRDPEAFEALQEKAIPLLLKNHPRRNTLRVWVPGCSTGEEAYSMGIVLRESLDKLKARGNIKIEMFATDIDVEAIEVARQGLYSGSIEADVSPERLQRFFTKEDGRYRIGKEVRQMIIFATQNLIMDPPFTKLDLLCCRNLLIYFTAELQKRLLPLFHFSLNPGGILMLGSSESIGSSSDHFAVVDNQWKIFTRKESVSARNAMAELPSSLVSQPTAPPRAEARAAKDADASLPGLAQRLLLESFAPAAVVINASGDIIYVSGRTGKYLEPSPGKANLNVLAMAREGLRHELGAILRRATSQQREVTARGVKVRCNGGFVFLQLTVRPLSDPELLRGLLLVVFTEVATQPTAPPDKTSSAAARHYRSQIGELERELKHTREQLQSANEEMETSQEELKSTNEELQSTNEEIQSTNEELTTSKEELQSLNEELVTVNSELQAKVDELSQAGNDMKNLLNSTEIATIFLDNEVRIKRYTPQATKIINLIPGDLGRPIDHVVPKLKYAALVSDVREVIQTLAFKEAQVQTTDQRWYLMRIMPYRTIDNVIDGAVLTFTDITALKELEISLRESETRLLRFFEHIPVMVAAWDERKVLVAWNRECERLTGYKAEEIVGHPQGFKLLFPNDKYRAQILDQHTRREGDYRDWEWQITCRDGSVKKVAWSSTSKLFPIAGLPNWAIAVERPYS